MAASDALADTLIGIAAAGDPELAELLTVGELEDLVEHGYEQIARARFGNSAVDDFLHEQATAVDDHCDLMRERRWDR